MRTAFRRLLALIFFAGLFWLVWKFVSFNPDPLQLRFFSFRSIEMASGLLTLFVFLIGALLSAFLFFSLVVSSQLERRRLIRENASLQKLLNEHLEAAKKKVS